MSTLQMLRALVDQRLTAAVEEIFVVLERTIAEYEAELSRTKEENYQLQDAVFKKHQDVLHRTDVRQPPHIKEEEEDRQPPHIKEEEEEVWITQEEECLLGQEEADVRKFPLTVVSVKTEEHKDKPPESSQLHHSPNVQQVSAESYEEIPSKQQEWSSSVGQKELQAPSHIKEEEEELWEQLQRLEEANDEDEAQSFHLQHSQSEENRGAELVSQHITEADGQHCEDIKSQPDSLFAPLSDMDHMMSDSSDHSDHIQKSLERKNDSKCDTRHHTNNKHFDCSECGKSFRKRSNFTVHMRIHTGEKPFTCSVCKKSFSKKQHMTTHMRTHTGEKPFPCSVCKKSFSMKLDMTIHMRTHTGEKPFTCSVCKKSFSRKQHMTRHMRTHTGEKHFPCSVCKKSFSRKQHMTTHMRTHTGEKPFSCTVCVKRFRFKNQVSEHKCVAVMEAARI
ncbi:zinc finger protein 33A-like isoform X2 [Nerophis ophidion]|uniref:zinc finger protein 33A-like isoform X2 n=1 Tax=Nerophis ophidion TaxID=159077 RepID=UPI002ADF6D1E|nr:zinc finger protein 33A-like isoform X2 [Nerophis ophidion]